MYIRRKSSVMSGRDPVCSKSLSILQQRAKLDASVALQIRVRGQAFAVLGHKVAEDLVPVLIHKVSFVQWDA